MDKYLLFAIIFLGVIILLVVLATILDRLFPNNKLSKKLDELAEWIEDNVRF